MGIHNFRKKYGEFYRQITGRSLRGNILAIDALHQLYKSIIGTLNNGSDLINEKTGRSVVHLSATVNIIMSFIKNGTMPVLVWDGKVPIIKNETIKKRETRRNVSNSICNELNDKTSKEYIRNFKRTYVLKDYQIMECQNLLKAMGIPYIDSLDEGDQQCAVLTYNKDIYAVVSGDTDPLVFGAKTLIMFAKNKVLEISRIELFNFLFTEANKIKKKYGLKTLSNFTQENFVDWSILMGTDYTPCIKGFKTISELDALYEIFVINNLSVVKTIKYLEDHDYEIPEAFIEKWKHAREYYLESNVINPHTVDIKLKSPNRDELIRILHIENNFNINRVNELIEELENIYDIFNSSQNINMRRKYFDEYKRKSYSINGSNNFKYPNFIMEST